MQQTQKHIEAIQVSTNVIDVVLMALDKLTDKRNKNYYANLEQEDIAHNMEMLFTELSTIHALLLEETTNIMDNVRTLQTELSTIHGFLLEKTTNIMDDISAMKKAANVQ